MEALLVHELNERKVKVCVLDNATGTYSLSFTVASEGTWHLRLKVNPLRHHQIPSLPPVDAPDTLTQTSIAPHPPRKSLIPPLLFECSMLLKHSLMQEWYYSYVFQCAKEGAGVTGE